MSASDRQASSLVGTSRGRAAWPPSLRARMNDVAP